MTPSAASHAATAEAVAWFSLAAAIGPPMRSLHHDLTPHLRGLESRPIDRRRIGENPVELLGQFLREYVALPSAGRAAVPVVVRGLHRVVGLCDRLGKQDLLLHSVTNEIVDELVVVSAVRIDAGFAVAAAVAGVAARPHIARIDGTVDGKASRAAAAADSLRPAVPGTLCTPPVPPSTELSGNPTRTLMFWSGFSPYRMFTWQYAAFAPAAATRWLSADLIPGPPVRPLPRAAQVTGTGAGGAGFLAMEIAGASSAEPKRLRSQIAVMRNAWNPPLMIELSSATAITPPEKNLDSRRRPTMPTVALVRYG